MVQRKNEAGSPFLLKLISAVLPVMMIAVLVAGLWPTAYAAGYRLTRETRDGETVLYDYDRAGNCTAERIFYDGKQEGTVNCYYAGDGTLAEKVYHYTDSIAVLYFHYDSAGTRIEMENPGMGGDAFSMEGEQVKEQKDSSGRTTMMTGGDSPESTYVYYYSYDAGGRISMFEISGYRRDTFTYYSDGGFNRTSTLLRENTSSVTERYNADGRLEMSRDQYGIVHDYYYDRNGRLTEEYYDGELLYSYTYTVDSNGNVSEMVRSDRYGYEWSTVYQYEKAG